MDAPSCNAPAPREGCRHTVCQSHTTDCPASDALCLDVAADAPKQHLLIDVDRMRVAADVAAITDTDFFRHLEHAAQSLRAALRAASITVPRPITQTS